MAPEDPELLEVPNAAAWHGWLAERSATSSGVWLAIGKKGGSVTSLSYEEAVLEAISFGWVDSMMRPIDAERYRLRFTPRKRGSQWSRTNKERVDRLMALGRMQPGGLLAVEAAKADGSWSMLDDVEALIVPDDLGAALRANARAESNFQAMSDSAKQQFLFWLASAKRPGTRAKRLEESVRLAERGLTPDRRGEL